MSKRLQRWLYFFIVLVALIAINLIAILFISDQYYVYYYPIITLVFGTTGYVFSVVRSQKRIQELEWLESKMDQMNQITYAIKRVGEVSINDFPFGVILFDSDFTVSWSNNFVKQLFGTSYVGKSLSEIHEEIVSNVERSNQSFELIIDDYILNIEFNEEFSVLFLQDLTEISDLQNQYNNRRLTMGYLTLDNLDETLANMDVQDRIKVQGSYFSAVGEWAERYEIYVKGLSSEKFQILMDYEQLQNVIEDEFSILSDIRKVSKDSSYQITASIGLACYDESAADLGERVNDAQSVAFDRGGDQAVVDIQGEQMKYFGAKSDTIEKRSRVKARMTSGQLLQYIKDSSNVVVLTHKVPDHDALGAMIGVKKFVDFLDKKVDLFFDYEHSDALVQKIFNSLAEEDEHFRNMFTEEIDSLITDDTLIIIVDVNNPVIIHGDVEKYDCKKVVIDHHRRGTQFVDADLSYVEPYASSSVELVVELMQFYENDVALSQMEATLMLIGIIVDTNNFSWRTGARTFDAASFLRLFGANLTDIKKYLREDYDSYLTQSRLLSTSEVFMECYGIITSDVVLQRVQLAKLSDQLLMIDNVDASVVISELEDGLIGISARSFGDVNVQVLMEALGGGGHLNNAAAQVEGTIDEMYTRVKDELEKLDKEV